MSPGSLKDFASLLIVWGIGTERFISDCHGFRGGLKKESDGNEFREGTKKTLTEHHRSTLQETPLIGSPPCRRLASSRKSEGGTSLVYRT